MSDNFSRKLSLFSFVFSIIVVAGHLIDVASTDIFITKVILRCISCLVAVAMGYFFFVSGYLFFRKFDMSQLTRKWKKRVKRLLITIVFRNFIGFIVSQHCEVPEELKIWQLFLDVNHLADGPLWYILCIMVYIISAPVFYWLIKKKVTFWIFWMILLIGNITFNLEQKNAFFYSLPLFILGAGVALHYHEQFEGWADTEDRRNSYRVVWIKAILLFAFATMVLLLFFYDVYADYHKYSHYLNRILAPLIVFGCFRKCEIRKEHPLWKSSFFIYSGHEILVNECMNHYVVKELLFHYSWVTLSIVGIGGFTLGVVGSLILLYVVLQRFCPKICAILSGNR